MTLRPARVLSSIASIDAPSWNALAGSEQPFVRHEFLLAMEQSGGTTARTGWIPQHLIIDSKEGRPVAALPLYRKLHSRGEFVFDFSWANAYAQHGLDYYPKLLSAIPFTPVRGPRLLLGSDAAVRDALGKALTEAALEYARDEQFSSWHISISPGSDSRKLGEGWPGVAP